MIDPESLLTPEGAPDRAAIEAYMRSAQYGRLLERPEFDAGCNEVFRRIEAGEGVTIAEGAALAGLPWPVWALLMHDYAPGLFPPQISGAQ